MSAHQSYSRQSSRSHSSVSYSDDRYSGREPYADPAMMQTEGTDELQHFLSIARIGMQVIKFPTYGGFLSKEEPREIAILEDSSGRCAIRWRKPYEFEWQDDKMMLLRDCQQVIRGGGGDPKSMTSTKLFKKDGDHARLLAVIGGLRSLHIKVNDQDTRDFWANGIEMLISREKELIQQAIDSVNAATQRVKSRNALSPMYSPVAARSSPFRAPSPAVSSRGRHADSPRLQQNQYSTPRGPSGTPKGSSNHSRAPSASSTSGYEPDAFQKVFLTVFGANKIVVNGEDANGGDTVENRSTPGPAGGCLQLTSRIQMVEEVLDSYSSGDVMDSDLVKTSIGGPIVRDERYYNARLRDTRQKWLRFSTLKNVSDVALAPGHTSGPYVEMRPAAAKRGEVARWENTQPFHKMVMTENEGKTSTWREEIRVDGAEFQRDLRKEWVWRLDMPSIDVKPGMVADYEAPPFMESEAVQVCGLGGDPPTPDQQLPGYRVWLCGKRIGRPEWEQLCPPAYLSIVVNRPGSPDYNPNLSQSTFLYAIDRKTNFRFCIHKVSPKVNYTNQFGPETEGDAFLADKWIQWRHLAEGIDRALLFEDSEECAQVYGKICAARYTNAAERKSLHRVWTRDPTSDKAPSLRPFYASAAKHKDGHFIILKRHPDEPNGKTTVLMKIRDNTQFHNLMDYRQIHTWDQANKRWIALCFEHGAGCDGFYEFINNLEGKPQVNPNILRAWWYVYVNDKVESIESVCVQMNRADDRGAWVRMVYSNKKTPARTFLVSHTKFTREGEKFALVKPDLQYDPSVTTKLKFDTPDECGIVTDEIANAPVMQGCRRGIPCIYVRDEEVQVGTYSVWFEPNLPGEPDYDASKKLGVWLHWEQDDTNSERESFFVTDRVPILYVPTFGSSMQVWDRENGLWHRFATQSKPNSAYLFRSLSDHYMHPKVHHPTCQAGERVWVTTQYQESSSSPMMVLRYEANDGANYSRFRPRGTWLRCYHSGNGDTVFEQKIEPDLLYETYPSYKSLRLFQPEGNGRFRDVTITILRSAAYKIVRDLLLTIAKPQAVGTVKSPYRKELLLHGRSYLKLIDHQRQKAQIQKQKQQQQQAQSNGGTGTKVGGTGTGTPTPSSKFQRTNFQLSRERSRSLSSAFETQLPSSPEHEIHLHVPWSATQPVLRLRYEDPATSVISYDDMSDAMTVVDARWTAELANGDDTRTENLTFVVNRYVPAQSSMRAPQSSDTWYTLYWEYRVHEVLNSMKNLAVYSSIMFPRGTLLSNKSHWVKAPEPSRRELTIKFPTIRNPFRAKNKLTMAQRGATSRRASDMTHVKKAKKRSLARGNRMRRPPSPAHSDAGVPYGARNGAAARDDREEFDRYSDVSYS